MKHLYRHLVYLLMITLVATASARAEDAKETKPSQGPFAVLIGVGEFTDKAISPRPSADHDAKAVYDFLVKPGYIGIPANRIRLLTATADQKRNGTIATKENVLKALHEAVTSTGKDDLLVVGFFGRGAPIGFDKFAFFTPDSNFADRTKSALTGLDISDEMKHVRSQRLFAMLDLSFKGIDPGKETLAEPNLFSMLAAMSGTVTNDKNKDKDADEDDEVVNRDRVIMFASLPGNEPVVANNSSLFTSYLLKGLNGAADTDGYEADGAVTVAELGKYLDKEVTEQTRNLGKTTAEKEAVPVVAGGGQFVLTKNPEPATLAAKRAKAIAELVEKGTLARVIGAEGQQFVTRMPKLKTQQELRKQYQELADGKLPSDVFLAERTRLMNVMKLDSASASKFADTVYVGAETLALKYVKDIKEADMIANGLKLFYKRIDEIVSPELDAKLKAAKEFNREQLVQLLREVRLQLGKREDLENGKDSDLMLSALAASLEDPYTVYVDKETMKKEESRWRSQYSGIGIHIRRDLARDGLLVVSPIKGSPAYKAGLRAGDLIIEVRREVDSDGKVITSESEKIVSLRGMKVDKAIEMILGKPGVPVTIVVEREGEKEPRVIELDRARVSLETVLGVKRNDKDEWNFYLDEEKKIGYVYLSQFGPNTAPELFQAVVKLTAAGMQGFVLDLRDNPGGELRAALGICDMFLPNGKLLEIRPRKGEPDKFYDKGIPELNYSRQKFSMAVLINGGSASASEIVSAAMQDYDRAVIVGERTYGKGSVQDVSGFDMTGGVFKLTTARYFPPSGRNIDKRSTKGKPEEEWGVIPNKGYEIKLEPEERRQLVEHLIDKEHLKRNSPEKAAKPEFKDRQLNAAIEYLKKEIQARNNSPFKKAG